MKARKFIYEFDEGDGKNKMLLGGKGANLCEMTQIGLNVPPGFTITTEACLAYLERNQLPEGLMEDIKARIKALEKKTGKGFGSADNPLLVSVRSGSAMSMPGMMDTILNLGLNKATLAGLIKLTGNPRFGYDAWRRFIQLFGKIALNVDDRHFDEAMHAMKRKVGAAQRGPPAQHDLRRIGLQVGVHPRQLIDPVDDLDGELGRCDALREPDERGVAAAIAQAAAEGDGGKRRGGHLSSMR